MNANTENRRPGLEAMVQEIMRANPHMTMRDAIVRAKREWTDMYVDVTRRKLQALTQSEPAP